MAVLLQRILLRRVHAHDLVTAFGGTAQASTLLALSQVSISNQLVFLLLR